MRKCWDSGRTRCEMRQGNRLWYRQPAKEWIEALPIGNGRMGAMVYGGANEERIQIDESSFWSGAPSDENNRPGTRELMWEIRKELSAQNYEKADLLGHNFIGNKNQYGTNMPVGELRIRILEGLSGRENQRQDEKLERSLFLEEGIAKTTFELGGSTYLRECFLSNPAQVFCLRLEADQPFSVEFHFAGIGNNTCFSDFDGENVLIEGDALETLHSDGKHGVHFQGCTKFSTDGMIRFQSGKLFVEKTRKIDVFLDLETTMFLSDPGRRAKQRVCVAWEKGYETLKEEHIADVSPLFHRMEISLGEEEKHDIPTDVRLAKAKAGEEDLALYALMYQYGRYLLIASSREDSPLPTHMGGIWNDNIYNNIDCTQDMHIDMNLQMQYWACAQTSLPECYQPFFRYLEEILIPSGEKTAKEAYGADGWTAHVVSNPWGFTSLGWAYNWGVFSLGGAWCAVMAWDYYEYTGDLDFLQQHGLPILEGAAKFVLNYVFWDEKKQYFMTGPSYSPENQFSVDGKHYFLSLSNTCDVILVRELLEDYRKAIDVLKETSSFRMELQNRASRVLEALPPYRIGKKGQIQEWFYDFEEPIPNHRHTSHLLGIYPFWQIKPEQEPELAKAARVSIARRCEQFEITSWGMNMLLGYFARLKDGEKAQEILRGIFQQIVRNNLASVMADLDTMWKGTWELDGNTGLTAAMTELLIQSHEKTIDLLPALPPAWKHGKLNGISIKNGGKADLTWKMGKLSKAVIQAGADGVYQIRYGKKILNKELKAGERLTLDEFLQEQ